MKKPIYKNSLKNFFIFLTSLILSLLLLGFIAFSLYIARLKTPNPIHKADGIVVWTGKGGDRIATGAKLLSQKYGERLLISGTNRDLSRDTILNTIDLDDTLKQCCVDMDHAKDTVDNANETANWAKAMGYDHIILVTSAYHMPRAEIEIMSVIGRVTITPYPVRDVGSKAWWTSFKGLKRHIGEYAKLLHSFIRNRHARGILPLAPNNKG